MQGESLDLEWLLKVRTVVARTGEMDRARWWNTNGQLGPHGAVVLRRGFPRTHYFAQTRSVIAVAAARCAEIFDPPGCVTLWNLTESIEERLDLMWEGWLDDAKAWTPFFERVARLASTDVLSALRDLELVLANEINKWTDIKISAASRSIQMPDQFIENREAVALLALAFGASAPGHLVVPYARRADA